MEKKLEKREISKSVVVILLVLTVIISILGTWTVLDELERMKYVQAMPGKGTGNVKLYIGEPITNNALISTGEGKVSIKILEAE